MRYFIIKPLLNHHNLDFLFSSFNFMLLVLSTTILAASGYIINDYFDKELDNKANKNNIIGKRIKKKTAMSIHIILNIIAIAIGFYISIQVDIYKIGFIFILVAGLLWFYSSSYKKMFLVGNLIIALLAALVPLIIMLFEIPLQYSINKQILISRGQNLNDIIIWISGFSIFSFVLTLIREIIKDVEDAETDIMFNANTLPIILGINTTKIITTIMSLLTIIGLSYIVMKYLPTTSTIIYVLLLLILPLFYFIYKLIKSKTSKDFHFLSILMKIIMLTGVLYSTLAYFNF